MQFAAYKVKADHRNTSKLQEKTQWSVDEWEELRLFSVAKERKWTCPDKKFLWSISVTHQQLTKIGYDLSGDAYIAKYRHDHQHEWHGYPVVPKQFDRPPKAVLESWKKEGVVDNRTLQLILQGKI